MFFVRRNSEIKKKNQGEEEGESMEEEKLMEDEAKRKRERQRSGGAKISPPYLNLAKNWVNSVNKKKIIIIIFQSFQVSFKIQIFNSKIFIPKLSISHSQCPNFKLKSTVFKNLNFRFYDQNSKP